MTIDLGPGGWALLIGDAILLGVIAQFIGDVRPRFKWIDTAIAVFVGGLAASEILTAWTVGPVVDGLALVDAFIGGVIVGTAVDWAIRYECRRSDQARAKV